MSGKLPIDRVREAADAPRIYELEKQRFTEQQAERHQQTASGQGEAGPPPDQVEGRAYDQDGQNDPESPAPTEGRDRARDA